MTNDSLIELIEKEKLGEASLEENKIFNEAYDEGLSMAILLIKQNAPSEIRVVGEDAIHAYICDYLPHWLAAQPMRPSVAATNILHNIRPYLRTTEPDKYEGKTAEEWFELAQPEPVSIKHLARIAFEQSEKTGKWADIVEAVLDAAGVKYDND